MTAAASAIAALFFGSPVWAATGTGVAVTTALSARWWSRRHPGPMPYAFRWMLYMPRGPLSVKHLLRALDPQPGERLLELGPGIGIYSIPVAAELASGGRLDALDIQEEMLTELSRRAERAGITNVVATPGDAQRLPYADKTFDGAYLVTVLGEIPDEAAALRELRRVLKPGGRLVVGEALIFDPDGIRLSALRELALQAGFAFELREGLPVAYFARFRVAS